MSGAKSLYRNGVAQLSEATRVADAQQKARDYERRAAAVERGEAEQAKPAVPVDASVRGVRIRHDGWYQVVRVNKKTVTVVVFRSAFTGAEVHDRFPLTAVVAVAR